MQFTEKELKFLKNLNTPEKIQDFLDSLSTNWEPEGDTVISPIRVLRERRAHCIEAAMFAAFVLKLHGQKPLILDLTANMKDQDHVIALFKRHGKWGAIAKSNHHGLGYRDAVYKTVRELALSYFHEYLNLKGEKTLRSFSRPINMNRFDRKGWTTTEENVWYVPGYILRAPHYKIMSRTQEKYLRKADTFVRNISNLQRQKKPKHL